MAVKAFTEGPNVDSPVALYGSWAALTDGDVGARVSRGRHPDRTVHAYGTFGGTVTMRGSNKDDPNPETAADWFDLTDNAGNTLNFVSNDGALIAENVRWLSPIAKTGVSSVEIAMTFGTR